MTQCKMPDKKVNVCSCTRAELLLPRFKPTPKIKQMFKANLQLIDCTKLVGAFGLGTVIWSIMRKQDHTSGRLQRSKSLQLAGMRVRHGEFVKAPRCMYPTEPSFRNQPLEVKLDDFD